MKNVKVKSSAPIQSLSAIEIAQVAGARIVVITKNFVPRIGG